MRNFFRRRSPKPEKDVDTRPTLSGGVGGHGGKGGRVGGAGGLGEAVRIALEELYRFGHVRGGTGGNGGSGGIEGGAGGVGQGLRSGAKLVSIDGRAEVPTLTVAEFCREYHVSDRIRFLLDRQGFETAGALLEVSDVYLLDEGFKGGQIAEMKRALKEFLSKNAGRFWATHGDDRCVQVSSTQASNVIQIQDRVASIVDTSQCPSVQVSVLSPWLATLHCASSPRLPLIASIGPSTCVTLTLTSRNLAQRQGDTCSAHRRRRVVFRKHAPENATKILIIKEPLEVLNVSVT
ncbi:hypothetical protein B0H17DRAFT_1333751, partial [Mycena rosella]